MNSNKLKQMYGSTPNQFKRRIVLTLQKAEQQQARKRKSMRVILITTLLGTLMIAVACAAVSPQIISYFSRLYGETFGQQLHEGNIDMVAESHEMNGIVYTIDEVIYRDNVLYGVGTIRAKDDAPILLIPEDFPIDKPYGYDSYNMQLSGEVPQNAPSVAQLAKEQGKKVMMVQAIPERVGIGDGDVLPIGSVGYTYSTTMDGTIMFSFEIVDGENYKIEENVTYTIDIYIAATQTNEGVPLFDTRQSENWEFTVVPTIAHSEEMLVETSFEPNR